MIFKLIVKNDVYAILYLCVDIDIIKYMKHLLLINCDTKNLGPVNIIIGNKIIKKNNDIIVTQSHYIQKILKKFNHFCLKPILMSYDSSIKLKENLGEDISFHKYS